MPEEDDVEVEDSLYSNSANKATEEETDLGPEGPVMMPLLQFFFL